MVGPAMTFMLIFIGLILGVVAYAISRGYAGVQDQKRQRHHGPYGGRGSQTFHPMGWGGFALGLVTCILLAPAWSALGTQKPNK